jgi:type I restriction enzyme R subunit
MRHYTEKDMETHIENYLADSNEYEKINTQQQEKFYDKSLCLYSYDFIKFIKNTQTEKFKIIEKHFKSKAENRLIKVTSDQIKLRGVIDVIHNGINEMGQNFKIVYFIPKSKLNKKHNENYIKNIFSIMRQFNYSKINQNSVDLCLLINGIPLFTFELKNSLTNQNHLDAIKQYIEDRNPEENIFNFNRCIAHFAVGTEEIFFTTKLEKKKTTFLPFNKSIKSKTVTGIKTSFLWKDILVKKNILNVIENFVHISENEKIIFNEKNKKIEKKKVINLIFPRYHQLDAVNKIEKDLKVKGSGQSYLIEHATGSGKSFTIGWLALKLINQHIDKSESDFLFDSVIIVSDRKNIDKQLTYTLRNLENIKGIVGDTFEQNSKQLKKYLDQGKKIIISTVQKYVSISKQIKNIKDKNFAIIIDEVHSSQEGKYSSHLKIALSNKNIESYNEGENNSDLTDIDKKIFNEIKSHGKAKNITFFGFSGTPKSTTLEIFGTKNSSTGKKESFHKYSMHQSISENFTLNVLKNYTTYKRFFQLNIKNNELDKKLSTKEANKKLIDYVDISKISIEEKSKIILNHFKNKVSHKINNQAKAIVVCKSRLHCVLYKKKFDELINKMKLNFECLVAFSDKIEIEDKERKDSEVFTEASLNKLKKGGIEENFKHPKYKILIVSNKFQTGYDEPLLHTMYVDKKIKDLQCVQTLSRLNRTLKHKEDTFVLDFVNESSDIQKYFQKYYSGSILAEEVDQSTIYKLKYNIEKFNIFSENDIDLFIKTNLDKSQRENIFTILDNIVEKFNKLENSDKDIFKSNIFKFLNFYDFLINIITFQDLKLYKLYKFLYFLIRKLPKDNKNKISIKLNELELSKFKIIHNGTVEIMLEDKKFEFDQIDINEGIFPEIPTDTLENIVLELNKKFGTKFDESEKSIINDFNSHIKNDNDINNYLNNNNSKSNIKYFLEKEIDQLFLKTISKHPLFFKKTNKPIIKQKIKDYLISSAIK